jgi:hypothetical protein
MMNATGESQVGLQAGPFGIVQVSRITPSSIVEVPDPQVRHYRVSIGIFEGLPISAAVLLFWRVG